MEGINYVYDRVLSGYIVTDVFIHKDFPDTYFGNELDHTTYKRLKEDETFVVQTLKEIVGTFMKNGKISDTFWVHDKIFIGDEGICLLGEILTICQIVAYIDSDDLTEIESNDLFKKALLKELKDEGFGDVTLREDRIKKEEKNDDVQVDYTEDSKHKYICVLLTTGGRQQVRVLRFNKYCESSSKLLATLKGTITFLNDLRCLFKDFRAQVVLKDKLRREFFAYLNFRKTEPNFRGSKIASEFFNSLHSRAIQSLFVGLNEHYLSLLEEAISYCPIVTYAFYKNIYLLKNIDINAPRRTWKVVCNLQKLYKHMKKIKDQMVEGEEERGALDEAANKKTKGNLKNITKNSSNSSISFNNRKSTLFCEKSKVSKSEENLESFFTKYKNERFSNSNSSRFSKKYRNINSGRRSYEENRNNLFFFETDNKNLKKDSESKYGRKTWQKSEVENKANDMMCSAVKTRSRGSNNTNYDDGPQIVEYTTDKRVHELDLCEKKNVFNLNNNKEKEEKGKKEKEKEKEECENNKLNETCLYITSDEECMSNEKGAKNLEDSNALNKVEENSNCALKGKNINAKTKITYFFEEEEEEKEETEEGSIEKKNKKIDEEEAEKEDISGDEIEKKEKENGNNIVSKAIDDNITHREKYIEETRANMVKLFKTYGGQCRIGKVHGRCEDATFQTDFPPAFGIFDGVGSWSLEGIDASKFSIGLALACQREAEKLSKNLDGYAQLSHNTIVRSKLLLKNSHLSVKNDYTEAYGSSTAIVGIIDEYTGKCGIVSLGDSVCMILRREFLPETINFERESYPKFPGESFLYFNEKGRNPSIIRKIIWKTTDQKWENGAPYQLSNLPGRSEWKDLERRGFHSFVKILEKVDIDGDSPDMAISPASEILCMPGDLILLMSDGVSDNLFDEEIEAYCTFAISPEEACELGDPSLFTPAQDVAYAITNIAKRRSGDKLHHRPFLPFAGRYREQNQVYKGSKVDDISCVAVWVVCENEESVKNFVKYPDKPSSLETDRYYNNNILYAFNEMSKLCTPSKLFMKNKDKIERINFEHPDTIVRQYPGEVRNNMIGPQVISVDGTNQYIGNSQMGENRGGPHHEGIFTFDTTETPIKFGKSKKSKDECQDLSDIIMCDNDNEEITNNEKEDADEESEEKQTNDEEKRNKSQKIKKGISDSFHDEYLNKTPEPLQGKYNTNLNDDIEQMENLYINAPPIFSVQSSKINQRNLQNAPTTASMNEAVKKAQFLQSLNYETPVKQMKRTVNNNNNMSNISNSSNSTDSMTAALAEAQFKEKMRLDQEETPLKMNKNFGKFSKRKSTFGENLDSPTKTLYAPKRSKRV